MFQTQKSPYRLFMAKKQKKSKEAMDVGDEEVTNIVFFRSYTMKGSK